MGRLWGVAVLNGHHSRVPLQESEEPAIIETERHEVGRRLASIRVSSASKTTATTLQLTQKSDMCRAFDCGREKFMSAQAKRAVLQASSEYLMRMRDLSKTRFAWSRT